MKTSTALIILGVLVIFIVIVFSVGRSSTSSSPSTTGSSNVSIVNGQQIVQINAKGGYAPLLSEVKAGIPTIIRFNTKGTYDCSSTVRIPSLGINQYLAPTGTTDVNVGVLASGSLQGTCGMGMYRFTLSVKG